MSIKTNLIRCKNDYLRHGTPKEIHLIWNNGEKSGIGNPKAIQIIMDAIHSELDKQINESV